MEEPQAKNSAPSPITKVVIVSIIIGVVLGIIIVIVKLNGEGYLSYENYLKINNGMTYSEVVEVLDGHEGELSVSSSYTGYSATVYTWTNSDSTKIITVYFDNNRVTSKAQVGLT